VENSHLIGLSRQMSLQRELEVVANNVANLNTTGFKADGALFEEYIMPTARANQFRGNDQQLSYVRDRATWLDFSNGPTRQTGNSLDIALDGDAFLVVQTPRGERYTRNGAFQLNAQGQLVTASGDTVMGEGGPIQFQPNDKGISISATGTISVKEGDQIEDSVRGKLRLVNFPRRQQLQKDGTGLFAVPNNQQPQPVVEGSARVMQGTLEQSNVSPILEMARMIEVSRSYTQVANMLQQQSDQRRSSIEKLADIAA